MDVTALHRCVKRSVNPAWRVAKTHLDYAQWKLLVVRALLQAEVHGARGRARQPLLERLFQHPAAGSARGYFILLSRRLMQRPNPSDCV